MTCSPFPGMDPYLEAPTVWPDVHTNLMNIFQEQLTPLLVPKYFAELKTQIVIDRLEEDPEVFLPETGRTTAGVHAAFPTATTVAEPVPVRIRVPMDVPTRLVSVYIRQRQNETLVAVIDAVASQ